MLPTSPHDAIFHVWREPVPDRGRWHRYLCIQLFAVLGLVVLLYWLPQS